MWQPIYDLETIGIGVEKDLMRDNAIVGRAVVKF